jgi:uncharacterized RDD family membrane protein YckC
MASTLIPIAGIRFQPSTSAIYGSTAVLASTGRGSCANHPAATAAATCTRCGNFVCIDCYEIHQGADYCIECLRRVDSAMPKATRGARFVAKTIDAFAMIGTLVAFAFVGGAIDMSEDIDISNELVTIVWAVIFFGGQGGLLAVRSQTLGKLVLGIQIRRVDGSRADILRILLLRQLVPIMLSFIPLFGLIDALFIFGDEQRCIHDLIADTIVVDLRAARVASDW